MSTESYIRQDAELAENVHRARVALDAIYAAVKLEEDWRPTARQADDLRRAHERLATCLRARDAWLLLVR
jgi:hypothetical protein